MQPKLIKIQNAGYGFSHQFINHTIHPLFWNAFIQLHGNVVTFTQQGLEKLNDTTTIYFQHGYNHREHDALRQILEKKSYIRIRTDRPSKNYLIPQV